MTWLIVATIYWLGIHFLVAGPLRPAIAGRIGETGFAGLFSVLSAIGLAGLIFAWAAASYLELWPPGTLLGYAPLVLMPFALLFFVPSVTQKNPTSAGPPAAGSAPLPVFGITRITRHPMLWAFGLWALGHLLANGDLASLLFFGSFLVVSVNGMFSIDRKRRRSMGARYEAFVAQTSILPFAAAAGGRQTVSWREIGWWRPLAAVILYLAIIHVHGELFGMPAIPGLTMGG
ncbi:NnrU family protein [Marinibaculum pumilum]|uniref:NnrU family protein n=1 Tax=Marinibaculum pumilum TaxID=1766165 RepID=A0ABV7L9D9_9PROT